MSDEERWYRMECRSIISEIEKHYPRTYAEPWDNVGLLVGDENADIRKILVALDVTDETVDRAVALKADLVVTHHPLIFKPLSRLTMQDRIGRRILKMASHHISYYAMHTNFDVGGMAQLNASELSLKEDMVLQETGEDSQGNSRGLGRIGYLPEKITAGELAERVKKKYRLEHIRLYGNPDQIVDKVAVCSGSGKSLIPEALSQQADVYITGDLDYHSAIDAAAEGLILIDAGHYGTEFGFIPFMAGQLKQWFPSLEIEMGDIRQPYNIM